jgi:hypothetical protein
MNVNPTQFVDGVGAGLSHDGQTAELHFLRKDGRVTPVQFPTAATASVLLNIEQALGTLFEQQRAMLKGQDPRNFFAIGTKHVVKVQGAIAQGHPVVSFVLNTNVRLDFRLEPNGIHDLIEWLQGLEIHSRKPPKAYN